MKNPNGYGCVFKLSGKRRKPFGVRITTGWTENGVQIYKNLAYFEKRSEAMVFLAKYNENPYDIDSKNLTFQQVFTQWKQRKFPTISQSSQTNYIASFNATSELHNIKFSSIKTEHMNIIMDKFPEMHEKRQKIKILFNQLFKFGLERDIIEKDYSIFVSVGKKEKKAKKIPFSTNEIQLLWENLNKIEFVDTILIMIYSGLRVGELLDIKNSNVFIEKQYLIGGNKTEAGINRIIPINNKILPLISKRKNKHEYLILNHLNTKMSYSNYYHNIHSKWRKIMKELGLDHKPHDCRHTFATLMHNADVDSLTKKKIIGHKSNDLTEQVYTHKNLEQLIKAVNKI